MQPHVAQMYKYMIAERLSGKDTDEIRACIFLLSSYTPGLSFLEPDFYARSLCPGGNCGFGILQVHGKYIINQFEFLNKICVIGLRVCRE